MSQIISPTQISDPGFHFDFSGRTAVVTGGTDGIGLGTALAFARAHAQIVVCSRSEDRVRRAEARLKEEGAAVLGIATDARDETAVARLSDAAVDRFGGVDILVNNVGGSFSDSFTRAPILSLSSTDLLEAF
jgi:NAD(P)-dependent dehydrogenase (short-subunit alcohol dehydrogenase family)